MAYSRCALTALFIALVSAGGTAVAQDLGAGKALAEQHCGRCHATGLEDQSKLDIAPPFRKLVERYPATHLAEALAEGIFVGHPAMPEFVFEPHEIGNLLAYMDSLGRKEADD